MMNMMSLLLVAVVAFTYFGGQNVPKVLKDNKQMVLGVFVGVLLHQFMGIGVEGGDFGNTEPNYGKCMDCLSEKIGNTDKNDFCTPEEGIASSDRGPDSINCMTQRCQMWDMDKGCGNICGESRCGSSAENVAKYFAKDGRGTFAEFCNKRGNNVRPTC